MKKAFLTLLLVIAVAAITFIGCQRTELGPSMKQTEAFPKQSQKELATKIASFFPEIESIKLAKGEVVFFDVIWDKTTGKVSIGNISIENGSFVAFGSFAGEESTGKKYTVTCDKPGTANDWSATCDGKISCGQLIAKCLEEGGCATICSTRVLYVPANFEVVE